MAYKRYMVFTWSVFDKVVPFDCCDGSFDDDNEAVKRANAIGDYDDGDGSKLFCVFDRVEGIFIET